MRSYNGSEKVLDHGSLNGTLRNNSFENTIQNDRTVFRSGK